MIPLDVWTDGILSYCELIVHDTALKKTWVDHDRSITSVVDFDELIEQIFGDLDADNLEVEMLRGIAKTYGATDLSEALRIFLAAMREADKTRGSVPRLLDATYLLQSTTWGAVIAAAQKAIETSKRSGLAFLSPRAF